MQNSKPDGFHYLIEFFGCEEKQIDDVNFWKKELHDSLKGTTMESLHDFFFKFEPQGITGYLLLSASHISIHTWPENGYVVCDVFTCSSEEETEHIVRYLKEHVTHTRIEVKRVQRGYKVARQGAMVCGGDGVCTMEHYNMSLPILSTGENMTVEVVQKIVEIETAVQKIEIVDTKEFGKCLIIDGILQTAQKDHYLYDRELIKKLRPDDERILILGGGDGFVAQRVVSENPYSQVRVDLVDLDVEVIKACERYLGQDVFTRESVRTHIGDALHFFTATKESYDGVIVDLTDMPLGRKEKEQFIQFYTDICAASYEKSQPHAWIALQAGATITGKERFDAVSIITPILEKCGWCNVECSDVMIPSFGESRAFLFAQKK